MALLDKETRGILLGLGLGAGAVLAIRYVGPVLAAVARPLAKALIARSMDGFEKATEKLAEVAESFQDLVAEVRTERARIAAPQQPLTAASAAPPGAPHPGAN